MNVKIKFLLAALLLVSLFSFSLTAQEDKLDNWYFGVTGGLHSNKMRFSELDKSYFPVNKGLNGGVFSLFVQKEFGRQSQFGIRPQMSFLNRGGKLNDILISDFYGNTNEWNYGLKAHFWDFRIPLIYNFGKASSVVRPYAFLAPVLGLATGGNIWLRPNNVMDERMATGYDLDMTDANMAAAYFAGQIGAGVKFAVPIADKRFYVGVEANYELGFTDTYSKKEKNGESNDVARLFSDNYNINGTRKFSGFEVQAVISIPFNIFKAKKKAKKHIPEYRREVIVIDQPAPKKEEKRCYTLEEVIALMTNGENVSGKTICAVDAIHFDFAESKVKPESFSYLDKLAKTLIAMNKRVEVKGHTDNRGDEDFNMNLSQKRAEAVVEYLVKQGVSRDKLTYSYYGESRPLTTNATEEGRALNRRVEFTILNN